LIVGDKIDGDLYLIKKITISNNLIVDLELPHIEKKLSLFLISDTYLGLDQEYFIN
jgi:hypothetical protein